MDKRTRYIHVCLELWGTVEGAYGIRWEGTRLGAKLVDTKWDNTFSGLKGKAGVYNWPQNRPGMCGSKKYPYLPHGRSLEIPRGRGASTAKIYKGKCKAKLEIPWGREGSNEKTFHGGGMDIFWNHTINYKGVRVLAQNAALKNLPLMPKTNHGSQKNAISLMRK